MLGEGGGNILGYVSQTAFWALVGLISYSNPMKLNTDSAQSLHRKKKILRAQFPPFPPHLPTVPTVLPVEHQSAFATLLCYSILLVSHNQAKSRRNWSYNANTANNRPVRGNLWSCPIKLLWKWQKLDFYLKHLTWGEHQKNQNVKMSNPLILLLNILGTRSKPAAWEQSALLGWSNQLRSNPNQLWLNFE